jgi:hypothetical protein
MPGEARDYLHISEYYYREMLGILGCEWDVYDVEVPSGTNWHHTVRTAWPSSTTTLRSGSRTDSMHT